VLRDHLNLREDQQELSTDFTVALIRLLAQERPAVLLEIGRERVEDGKIEELNPRVREVLATFFEDYAEKLRTGEDEATAQPDSAGRLETSTSSINTIRARDKEP
jgi:hypothetical protein